MHLIIITFICSVVIFLGPQSLATEEKPTIATILKDLDHESFYIREKATQTLAGMNLSVNQILKIAKTQSSPEVKRRLNSIALTSKMGVSFKHIEKVDYGNILAAGKEADGKALYVAKIQHNKLYYIGKYNMQGKIAHFPLGDKEVVADPKNTYLFTGKGRWISKDMAMARLSLGTNSQGKHIYAARKKINGGLHIGMLIEGDTTCSISWGGESKLYNEFEVLCAPASQK